MALAGAQFTACGSGFCCKRAVAARMPSASKSPGLSLLDLPI
jgi:hypothetical protein